MPIPRGDKNVFAGPAYELKEIARRADRQFHAGHHVVMQ